MSEEMWSRKDFKTLALIFLVIGLLILVVPALYSLLEFMISEVSKPFIYVSSIIGNAILNIIGNNPLLFGAFFFITTAAIFGVGYFIKEDHDRGFYQLLIYLSWFIIPLIILLSTLVSAPEPVVIGFGFLLYIMPIYIFAAYKGLLPIINLIIDKFE